LQLLASLPEGDERQRHELALQLVLGQAQLAAKGLAAPEMGRAYARARELSHKVGEPPQVLSALQGLFTFHVNLSQLDVGRIIADEVLLLAEQQGDLAFQAAGSQMAGVVSLFQARFAAALGHFERAVSVSDTLGPGPPSVQSN
jgi:predicted ATPase